MRLFAKGFGQGVRQQRVRDKTKERAGTLPLALSKIQPLKSNFFKYCFQRGVWLL